MQLHLLEAQGVLLLQPHFNTFRSSAGARGMHAGTTTGSRKALPSGLYQPWSVGARAGGLQTVPPTSHGKMCMQDILSERCIRWREGAELGWLQSIAAHLVLPHLDTSLVSYCHSHQIDPGSLEIYLT